jgi:hypothetical protein
MNQTYEINLVPESNPAAFHGALFKAGIGLGKSLKEGHDLVLTFNNDDRLDDEKLWAITRAVGTMISWFAVAYVTGTKLKDVNELKRFKLSITMNGVEHDKAESLAGMIVGMMHNEILFAFMKARETDLFCERDPNQRPPSLQ